MTRVETTVTVGDDRVVTLQLPDAVPPGEHKVTLIVDGSESEEIEQPLIREGNVLVFAGKRVGNVESALDEVREERMQKLLRDADG